MDAETYPMVGQRIDLFGPSVEFLTPKSDAKGAFCVLRGAETPLVETRTSRRAPMDARPRRRTRSKPLLLRTRPPRPTPMTGRSVTQP